MHLVRLEGPQVNQPQSPPWAAGGTHPPVLILSPDIRSLISFFLPLLLNRSLIHFFRKAPPSQVQGQGQAGLRDRTVLLPLRSPQSEGEVKTSWDLDNTGRGHGSRLTQPDTEAGRQGGRAALQGVGRRDTGFPQGGVRTEWKEEGANMCKVQKQKGAWHIWEQQGTVWAWEERRVRYGGVAIWEEDPPWLWGL